MNAGDKERYFVDYDEDSPGGTGYDAGWTPHVSTAKLRAAAIAKREQLIAEGRVLNPVQSVGRGMVKNFWGKAWCQYLATLSDYESRLPRARSYVRNEAVLDLNITPGKISALVQGSMLYETTISISLMSEESWRGLQGRCTTRVTDVIDLLKGRLPEDLLQAIIHEDYGLFPKICEMKIICSCPDWASMCKHAAAALYGLGFRFDQDPRQFFTLRGVDPNVFVHRNVSAAAEGSYIHSEIAGDLGSLFGIDLR